MAEENAVQRFYGRWAGFYDLLATRTPGIRSVRERAVDGLALSPGDTVVEFGCGTGANVPLLRERVGQEGRVVGVDLTPGMLRRARRRVRRSGWRNVSLVLGDAERPPIESADAVLATFLVGMLQDTGEAVGSWTELLAGGDHVVLLDAAPRDRHGLADAAFRLFVASTTPPTFRLRYDDPPAESLRRRIEAARAALLAETDLVADQRAARGFVRITIGQRR